LELGFHFFLFILSWVFDLVLIYKFLPALWICLTAGVLFYVVYKKTGRNFLPAWLAMIFFASIKSNVNITGLWFFTPLTFAIPFIFLYVYFLTEGVEKQNKKLILWAVAIMAFLTPTHSVSVLFFIPALLVYLSINFRYVIKEYKFFLTFLIIPIVGILTFKYTLAIPWGSLIGQLLYSIQFRYGWGVLELQNSFTEVYSVAGYILAVIGLLFILLGKGTKKYLIFVIWPLSVFILMIIYRMIGTSYLSPYQRNLYYLAIALPFLSAFGLFSLLKWFKYYLNKLITEKKYTRYIQNFITFSVSLKVNEKYAGHIKRFISAAVVFLAGFLTLILAFGNYYNLPAQGWLCGPARGNFYPSLNVFPKFLRHKRLPPGQR